MDTCAVITLPPSLPAQAFALPGHTAAGRVSLAGQRTDRPGNDVPGSEPSSAQARTGYGCPIPRDEPAEPLSEPCDGRAAAVRVLPGGAVQPGDREAVPARCGLPGDRRRAIPGSRHHRPVPD